MLVDTNRHFCYWLQGYFEIGQTSKLDRNVLTLIKKQLDLIQEPKGRFTFWLSEVCDFLEESDYDQEDCAAFEMVVRNSLNAVFFHVIDNSYDTEIPRHELQAIHDAGVDPGYVVVRNHDK